MSYGTTSILTPEIAEAICEEWMEGKSLSQIVLDLQTSGHTVHKPDITWWVAQNRQVEIGGKEYGMKDLMHAVFPLRVMDMCNEMIGIADKAAKDNTCHHHARNRINVRVHAINMMAPKHVQLNEAVALGGVTLVAVKNEAFDEKVN